MLLMYGWSAVVSVGLVVIALTNRSTAIWIVAGSLLTVLVLTIWPVRTAPAYIGGRNAEVVDRKPADG